MVFVTSLPCRHYYEPSTVVKRWRGGSSVKPRWRDGWSDRRLASMTRTAVVLQQHHSTTASSSISKCAAIHARSPYLSPPRFLPLPLSNLQTLPSRR
ncbi:Os11g0418650 [Oryza sativa Japonica Group]|uniref:Os11g0418650 protein n=1 Tax=Oryza sativa subsp. japonica TaxID=39947 RepID=A0A0P0Y1V4_ORYSJ|nr:Os11g0418650 [Oryza sativa Japonica Group]